jgi:hypothetical protein
MEALHPAVETPEDNSLGTQSYVGLFPAPPRPPEPVLPLSTPDQLMFPEAHLAAVDEDQMQPPQIVGQHLYPTSSEHGPPMIDLTPYVPAGTSQPQGSSLNQKIELWMFIHSRGNTFTRVPVLISSGWEKSYVVRRFAQLSGHELRVSPENNRALTPAGLKKQGEITDIIVRLGTELFQFAAIPVVTFDLDVVLIIGRDNIKKITKILGNHLSAVGVSGSAALPPTFYNSNLYVLDPLRPSYVVTPPPTPPIFHNGYDMGWAQEGTLAIISSPDLRSK